MKIQSINNNYLLAVLYIICCVVIIIYMNGLITEKPITSDAQQNLRMGYHLYKNGVLSKEGDVTKNLSPTNYREPVPPVVSALFMYIHPGIDKSDPLISFENGENTVRIKQVNLIWIFFLLTGLGSLIFLVSKNPWSPFILFGFMLIYFIRFGNHFDVLTTELPAATMMVWTALFLVLSVKRNSHVFFLSTGLSMGILILTKASFFYLFIIIGVFLFFFIPQKKRVLSICLFLGGVIVFLGPWMARNYSIYEEFSITQRGGAVLYLRALENQMTADEIKGAVYLWGPQIYRDMVKGTALGAEESDFESGGKYVRINRDLESDNNAVELGAPNLAESFYSTSRAEINRLQTELGQGDNEASRSRVYNVMEEEAKKIILDNPFKHTFMSVLFLWRGIWSFPNATIPLIGDSLQTYLHEVINLVAYLSLFGFFILGLVRREPVLIATTIIPILLLLFQALVSHNTPRLSEPAIPFMLLCLTLLIIWISPKAKSKLFTS